MGMRMRELEGLFLDWLSSACTRGPAHCHQQACAPAILASAPLWVRPSLHVTKVGLIWRRLASAGAL